MNKFELFPMTGDPLPAPFGTVGGGRCFLGTT